MFISTSPAIDNEGLSDIEQLRENCNQLRKDEAGETAPNSPAAFMNWTYVPSSGNWIKRVRNADNNAWFDVYEINPITGKIVVAGVPGIVRIPADAMRSRLGTGWATYKDIQGTYFDAGEMWFDAISEIMILPAWRLEDWDENLLTVHILTKSDSIVGSGRFRISFVGRDAVSHEVWQAPMIDHSLDVFAVPGVAESLVDVTADLEVPELASNDYVVSKITRIDTPGPTTLKVLDVIFNYTRI